MASRATLLACCLFTRHEQRGQAHARRLFLASLVYLPVFFACLILHQRRPPAELGVAATVEAEALEQVRVAARSRGRELCLHEQMVRPGRSSTARYNPPTLHVATTLAPAPAPVSSCGAGVVADSVVSGGTAGARKLTGSATQPEKYDSGQKYDSD